MTINGNFHKYKFSRNHQQARQEKLLEILILRQGHDSCNCTRGNGNLARELSACFNIENDKKSLPCLSKHVYPCSEELPCQREHANSKGPFRCCDDNRRLDCASPKVSVVCPMFL